MPTSRVIAPSARVSLVLLAGWLLAAGCGRSAPEGSAIPESSQPLTGRIAGPAGSLYIDDGGTGGIPVVFVHSFAGSGRHWTAQLDHLRQSRRAVAIDLRGHGRSDPPTTNAYGADSLASDIAAAVDALGFERFVLVGHSMGGVAAIAYAGAHPDRLAGLVMVGTPGTTPGPQAQQVMTAMKADYEKTTGEYWNKLLTGAQPDVQTQVLADMKKVPQDASLTMIEAIFMYDPVPALRKYPGPKLIVDTPHGESPGALYHLAPEIPRQVITDTSHWPQMDKPLAFNQILDEFLATVN